MKKNEVSKALSALLCLTVLLGVFASYNTAMAAEPTSVTALYAFGNIVSEDVNGKRKEEGVPTLPTTGTSLWTSNSSLMNSVVRTYDNHGKTKHLRGDEVSIQVRIHGQAGGTLMVDGQNKMSYISTTQNVTSSYPFVMETTHTIKDAAFDPDAPYSIFTSYYMKTNPSGSSIPYTRYETNVYIYWDDSDRAAAPNVSFVFDAASGKMILSGANSSMEYRKKSQTPNDWQACTDAPMYFDASTIDTAYYVRYAKADMPSASQTQELILPAKRSAPAVSYDTTTELISGLTTTMELKFNDGNYSPVTTSTMNMSDLLSNLSPNANLTVNVRYQATATAQASADRVFTLYSRGEKPAGVVYNPVTISLSGYTTAMQYKLDTDTAWKSLSGTTVSLESAAKAERDVKVYVRLKPTASASASLPVEFVIPKLLFAPTGTLDYTNEVVANLANGNYQYSINGTTWSALTITGGSWDISKQISTVAKTLYLRKPATTTAPISASTIFVLPARAAAPTAPVFVYNEPTAPEKIVLSGLTADMQYKKSTDTVWTNAVSTSDVVFDIPAAAITYYVRVKPTGEAFCSANKTLTLSKRGTAPGCVYSTSTEMISSLNATMEMKIGTGRYTPIETGVTTYNLSDQVSAIPSGSTLAVSLRYKATATAPASADKVFTIYPRGAKPTTVTFHSPSTSLSGYTTAMEYRLDSDTAWKTLSGSSLSLETSAKADRAVKVYVRLKAGASNSASLSAELTIPQLQSGPTGTIDYINESIIGLANAAYQYGTNGTTWTALTVTNGKWDISSLITGSPKTLYLRKAATSTTPISAYTTFAIAARPSAPTAPVFVYNDAKYPERVLLSAVIADMQYKKSTDTSWMDVRAGQDVVLDVPTTSTTYHVRTKANAQSFASLNKSITLLARGTRPSSSYSTSTEIISSIGSSMEIKFGSAAYTPIAAGVTNYTMSDMVNAIPVGSTLTVNVRYKATATAPASADTIFTMYPRAAKPTTVVYNVASSSLVGYTTAMEYKLDTDTSWKALSGSSLSLETSAKADRAVKVFVRAKANASNSASLPVELSIPQLQSGPSGTMNYLDETIDGLPNGTYQYGTNGASWTAATVSNGKLDISSLVTSSTKTLYLRKAATSTTPISAYTTFAIAARPIAPSTPVFVYNDANHPDQIVLNGFSTDMQYKKSTDTEWLNGSSNPIVLEPQTVSVTYYVRTKATNQAWASSNKTLTLVAKAAAPTCTYNTTTETISGLNSSMEISFDNGVYTAIATGTTTYKVTDLINNLPSYGSLEVKVRRKATSTTPASLDKVFVINARTAQLEMNELLIPNEMRPEDVPPMENPPVENPPVENPPVENPPVENPPVENPPVENPPVENPPVENPPVENPPAENLPMETPSDDVPSESALDESKQ